MSGPESETGAPARAARWVKLGLLLFGLLLGAVAVAAMLSGEQVDLPMQYGGFD